MQQLNQPIRGIDDSMASMTAYIIDNSPEIQADRKRPAILILPGGGYENISDREADPIAFKYLAADYSAFVLRYSVRPSTYPVALLQAAEAMRLIRAHADEWHIDANRIAVIGFSAGGHLASNLATETGDEDERAYGYDPDEVRPNALLLAYPVITAGAHAHRGSFDSLLGIDNTNASKLDSVSIEKHIGRKTPPVFVWHTMTDALVPVENTMLLIASLKKAGVSVEAHLYPEGEHGLSLGTMSVSPSDGRTVVSAVQSWMNLSIDWLNRTLRPEQDDRR